MLPSESGYNDIDDQDGDALQLTLAALDGWGLEGWSQSVGLERALERWR